MIDASLQFAHPENILFVWIWLALFVAVIFLERRGSDVLDRFVAVAMQSQLVARPSLWRRRVRLGLLGVAGVALAIAMGSRSVVNLGI